jgi:hypothetical protein
MKRKDSVYSGLLSRDWLKVKTSAGRVTMQKRIETWGKRSYQLCMASAR